MKTTKNDSTIAEILKEFDDLYTEDGFSTDISVLQDFIAQALLSQRESDIQAFEEIIENYFRGLIVIPDPQATKENIIAELRQKLRGLK